MRYTIILFAFIGLIANIKAQTVNQPGFRDHQISGHELPDSILYILATDTLDGSSRQGLGQFYRVDSMRWILRDTDWLRYRNHRVPSNTDTMYHVGIVNIGMDSVYSGKINALGRLDLRYPGYLNQNIAIGESAINSTSTSNQYNIAIGRLSLYNATGVTYSVAIGDSSLYTTATNDFNLAIGARTLARATSPTGCVAIGYAAMNASSAIGNVAIGNASGEAGASSFNTLIGTNSGKGGVTSRNTIIGYDAGLSIPISDNTFIGYQAGRLNTGSGNVFIGKEAAENETGSNLLYIDNSNTTTPLIGGDFSADTLRVNGDLSIRDAVSGASTDSVLVWTPSNGRVKMRNASAFSGGATDLTIGGAGPSYTIESSTGTDVTVANLYGLTLSESPANTLNFQVDTSKVATQYDISGFGTMSNWLLAASGTGGTETITNGETVTVSETTGLDVTRSTNTVSVALSIDEFSTDAASEGDELMLMYDPSGTNHELIDINDLPYVATEVDGSTSNELNTIEENNVSVQTGNITMDFQDPFDVAADGGTEVNVSLDGSEFATVTTAESTDYLLIHDSNGAGADVLEKMLWSDFVIDIIGFEEDNVNEGSGNTIDLGTGLDGAFTTPEYDISLDFNEFSTDAAAEGDEYIILYDPSAGDEEKLLLTTVTADLNGMWSASNDNTNIANSTFEVGVPGYLDFRDGSEHDLYIDAANDRIGMGTNSPNYGLHVKNDAGAAIEASAAGVNEVLKIEGTADGGGVNNAESSLLFNYTDADYSGGAEQQGLDMTLYKEADATQWTTLKMTMKEATDADAIVLEKNADFTGNTTESHVAFNGGIAYTQNYDGSTAGADLNLDRSYYTINITGGNLTDTIKLPEVAYTTDNWNASLTSTQCQVGQEYVISNLRSGVNLVISAYNPAGTSDDLIGTRTAPGGAAGSAISIAPGKSVIVKCYQLSGGIGYWNYWLSN